MKSDDCRLVALRYSRAHTLLTEALHTLSCEPGGMRERLNQIDPEFFALRTEDLPEAEGLRASFAELRHLVTRLDPSTKDEGRVAATLRQSHHTKLKAMAQLIWNIHRDFPRYMQSDA